VGFLASRLAHPLTRGLSVDDPRTTELRRDIVLGKPFLRALYLEWYARIKAALPRRQDVLEIGSGGGFFSSVLPQVVSSELFAVPGVDVVADACALPFADLSLDAIVMTDVFHHIPDVEQFLTEATRCVRPSGRIVMVEPWYTPWSGWVYRTLHPEPFEPDGGWTLSVTGPLSGANGALPWIVFQRDRAAFEARFPQWRIAAIEPLMPLCYLLSGGVSLRSLMPGFMYRPVRALEGLLQERRWAMFALIVLAKHS
jgi:SAM-dependent methyltransferase